MKDKLSPIFLFLTALFAILSFFSADALILRRTSLLTQKGLRNCYTHQGINSMTKADILNDLRAARAEWDELIVQVSEAQMMQTGLAGYWSAKDVIAHLTAVDQWNVNALRAHACGEPPPALNEQLMELEERNRLHYERNRQRPLGEILQESRQVFQQLVELLEAESEAFLTQPQRFKTLPEPIIVGKSLKDACADHYRHHMPDIRAWLENFAKK